MVDKPHWWGVGVTVAAAAALLLTGAGSGPLLAVFTVGGTWLGISLATMTASSRPPHAGRAGAALTGRDEPASTSNVSLG